MQIISGRGVNGALVYCKILSEELARRGHQVTLLCRPNSWMTTNVDSNSVRIVESNMGKFQPGDLKRVTALIREQEIDLVHSHMTRGQNFAIALKLFTGTPVVATAHNSQFQVHWNFNDYVIANSNSTFEYHSRVNRVPDSRMATIYCCTDWDRLKRASDQAISCIRAKLRFKPDDFLIGLVGEIAVRKGHIHLVRAMPEILKRVPNARLVFVGRFGRKQQHVRQIRKYIIQNGLVGRTKWVGRQSNIADYMSACDLTVVPSLDEPLGLVAIESLVVGTPVIASDTGGLREIVLHEKTGLLVPTADEQAIAKAVIKLADDEPMRKQLASAGRAHVSKIFSPSHLIDQVEQVYNHVVLNRKRAA